ncbi:MAG: hypothetical protein KA105_02910 [Caulobacter sp.]|nr:hypothetical protein [Caulobacter sp.]
MRKILTALGLAAVWALTGASSCATTGGEPEIRTVTVEVPVVQPCPDKRDPAPDFVDRLEVIQRLAAEGKFDTLIAVLTGGRDQRIEYQAASDAQIAACAGDGKPPP